MSTESRVHEAIVRAELERAEGAFAEASRKVIAARRAASQLSGTAVSHSAAPLSDDNAHSQTERDTPT